MNKFIGAARTAHKNNMEALRVHDALAQMLRRELRKHWSHNTLQGGLERSWSLEWSTQLQRIVVNCYLAPDDSLREDITPLLEELMIVRDLHPVNEWISPEASYKAWVFNRPGYAWRDSNRICRPVGVTVYFHFEKSDRCSKRGTGKYEEIEEIVCE